MDLIEQLVIFFICWSAFRIGAFEELSELKFNIQQSTDKYRANATNHSILIQNLVNQRALYTNPNIYNSKITLEFEK